MGDKYFELSNKALVIEENMDLGWELDQFLRNKAISNAASQMDIMLSVCGGHYPEIEGGLDALVLRSAELKKKQMELLRICKHLQEQIEQRVKEHPIPDNLEGDEKKAAFALKNIQIKE